MPPSTKRPRKATEAAPRLSRLRQPPDMDPADWQRALRRQFGAEQTFTLDLLSGGPIFGDWRVANPGGGAYRVAIRGLQPGDNFCACADYASNGLGTCKHIEFALHRLQRKRGTKAAFAQGWQPPFSEIWLQYGEPRRLRFSAAADCPRPLRGLVQRFFEEREGGWHWRNDTLLGFDTFALQALRLATAAGHTLTVHEDVLALVAQARDAHRRAQVLEQAYPQGAADKGLRKLVATTLYPYQAEGALFAARAGRALLGDEMGLGKTVQAIAAAELMARHFGVQRVLVVCPTSLKHQWQQELQRFAGRQAHVLHGLRAARQQQWRDIATTCLILNYEALVRDADLALAWAPELLIVDEAQRVKNWNTQAARALKRIAAPAVCPNVLVLTGTPLENKLEELLSIVQVVDQQRLGPTWRLLHEHQQRDDAGRVIGYQHLDRIGARLAPILLRRRKAQVLQQLPERVDKTLFVALTPEQRVHHSENADIVARIVLRWRKTGYLSDVDQRRLQCALQNMRMACNSTWLLDHETDHGAKADELVTLLDEIFEDPDAKAVVFSQWLGTHEVLLRRIATRGWGHVFFHGSVPAEQRGGLVQRFHEDAACRLFLSTDAGGTGLNLQHAAAVVVNMDLPWNPAVLEQRIGRVHRMGQRRGVQVVNLVAENSIEHQMLSVLAFKKSLFAGVLDGGESSVFMEGGRLSRFMKTVDGLTQGLAAADAVDALEAAVATAPMAVETVAQDPATPEADPGWQQEGQLAEQAAEPSPAPDAPQPMAAAAPSAAPAAASPPGADPWAPFLQAGLQLLDALAAPPAAGTANPLLQTDAQTGERYLRVPLPDAGTLQVLAQRLGDLIGHKVR
jgi:superfamily II DNA or RNA helicase